MPGIETIRRQRQNLSIGEPLPVDPILRARIGEAVISMPTGIHLSRHAVDAEPHMVGIAQQDKGRLRNDCLKGAARC